jgi:peptidoglycan/LPS O-acetylase OafA/YrhL
MLSTILVLLTFSVSTAIHVLNWYYDQQPSYYIDAILFGVLAATWVKMDSRKRKIYFPSDLVLIFAFIYFPVYAFQSRGWKGTHLILIFIGLSTCFSSLEYGIESLICATITESN